MKGKFQFAVKGNFIENQFGSPIDPNGEIVSRCPGDTVEILGETTKFTSSGRDCGVRILPARSATEMRRLGGCTIHGGRFRSEGWPRNGA
jgi:hypothetical protein